MLSTSDDGSSESVRRLFTAVHCITYLVWELNSVEAFFQESFDLEPDRRLTKGPGRAASLSYQIGDTALIFVQPAHPASSEYETLRRNGAPVVSKIGLSVNGLRGAVRGLKDAGVEFAQEQPQLHAAGESCFIDVDPQESCGMRILNPVFGAGAESDPDGRLGIELQLCGRDVEVEGGA